MILEHHATFGAKLRSHVFTRARREFVSLAQLCSMACIEEWDFNEWHHGVTGRPMSKGYQPWSAAIFVKACHALQITPEHIDKELR